MGRSRLFPKLRKEETGSMIRTYQHKDREALINLLRLNTPLYFAEAEEDDFIDYLDHHLEDYFVVEEAGNIIAAGGLNYFPDNRLARISWDMVHPEHQGKGIGGKLTSLRIEHARSNPAIDLLVVRTSQLVYLFYQKMGFTLEKTEKDFWAKGFDLYQMTMPLKAM